MELVAPSSLFKCSSSHTPKSRLRVFPQKSLNFSMHHHLHNLKPMESHTTTKITCFSKIGEDNGSPSTISLAGRIGEVKKVTKETNVQVKINLDGSGTSDCDTGIPFLDHMLDQLSSHGLFDVNVKAIADIHIDDHHTNEDIALTLLQALGDWTGINWFGDFSAPLDEALVHVALIYLESGRPHLGYDLRIPADRVGKYDTQLVEHFFQSIVNTSWMTLHIRQLAGKNSHHIIEATFKAFTRALRQATECDPRRRGSVPSNETIYFLGLSQFQRSFVAFLKCAKTLQSGLISEIIEVNAMLMLQTRKPKKSSWVSITNLVSNFKRYH